MSANAPGTDRTASSSSSKSKSKKKLLSPSTSWTHVNPSPVPEMSATGAGAGVGPAAPAANGERQRGPVEEVIAKRMRQLGKKLVSLTSHAAIRDSNVACELTTCSNGTEPMWLSLSRASMRIRRLRWLACRPSRERIRSWRISYGIRGRLT